MIPGPADLAVRRVVAGRPGYGMPTRGARMPDPFEGLPEVDWRALRHAHGRASDVPDLLRRVIAGGDGAVEAMEDLYQHLHHQGSLYPATLPAVPHLVRTLRITAADARVRAGLLALLGGIAGAVARGIEGSEDASERARLLDGLARLWDGADACRERLLGDPDAEVRTDAAFALGLLCRVDHGPPTAREAALGALRASAEQDGDELARASAVFALGAALPASPDARPVLRALVRDPDAPEAIRVAAAIGLVEADPRAAEPAAVAVLVRTLSETPAADTPFRSPDGARSLRWIRGWPRYRLVRILCAWSGSDEGRIRKVVGAVLAAVAQATPHTVDFDIAPVLEWAWPGRSVRTDIVGGRLVREVPAPLTELTPLGRKVVRACLAAQIWGSRVGNVDLVFRSVGLPSDRAQLEALARRRPVPVTPVDPPTEGERAERSAMVAEMQARRAWLPGRRVKLDFGDGGAIVMDGASEEVTEADLPSETTIRVSWADWKAIVARELDGMVAFLQGRLKVHGDPQNAVAFQGIVARLRAGSPPVD